MKKIILVLILLVFVIGCVEKECETNEDCPTKTCFIAKCKENNCVLSPISDCCGNEICEVGEIYPECVVDCPNCDDKNDCTVDEYDYHKQECVNTIVPNVICCGNSLCETGETYSNCARDCPNCEDDNKCTKDKYDYHEQRCVNEVTIPCCGNEICDKDFETYSICPVDCPNCDDNGKFTTDSFNYETQECENIVTHYFIDDFESGIKSWSFHGGEYSTEVENGNTYLKLGHSQANLKTEWDNYGIKFRFKWVSGSMHINFRHSSIEKGWNRYYVSISRRLETLDKQVGDDFQKLKEVRFGFDDDWHTLETRCYDNIINVYLDDELAIKYKDTEEPFLSGRTGFEVHTGGASVTPEFWIDDVEIKVISEEDIVYP
jgi:hypothetical protein